ncbi:MAG: sugar phosphate nucleotidyltransferase [Nitrospinota bacterium]
MDPKKIKSLVISKDESIKETMGNLNKTSSKILLVTGENDELVGVVTDGDLRRGIVNGLSLSDPVKNVMRENFCYLDSNTPDIYNYARELMLEKKIEQVPILNSSGCIVDIILISDGIEQIQKSLLETAPALETEVVVMAGGKGTRLDPFTKILPKPLIPLEGTPIIEHVFTKFKKSGFSNFILVLNYKKEMIKLFLSENKYPFNIEIVEEEKFLGTAGGLSLLKDKIQKTFVLTNCDTILSGNTAKILEWHKENKNILTLVGSHKEFSIPYGVLKFKDGVLDMIDEKPKFDLFINAGTYILEPTIFDWVKEDQFLNMDHLIANIIKKFPKKVGVFPHWEGWFDIGQWEEYQKSLEKIRPGYK